jgi:hypothetical protein
MLLNSTVKFVNSISALTTEENTWKTAGTAADHEHDFYYITGSNILAVYAEKDGVLGWQQINPDTNTKVTAASFTNPTSSSSGGTIELTIDSQTLGSTANSAYGSTTSVSATLKFETAGVLNISTNTVTNALVLEAPDYWLT